MPFLVTMGLRRSLRQRPSLYLDGRQVRGDEHQENESYRGQQIRSRKTATRVDRRVGSDERAYGRRESQIGAGCHRCVGLTAGTLAADAAAVLQVSQGTVTFEVGTNVPALRVLGKSSAVKAYALVLLGPEGAVVEHIGASLPVKSLPTGLALLNYPLR